MADKNYIREAGTTYTSNRTYANAIDHSEDGTEADIHDDSLATFYGETAFTYSSITACITTLEFTATFVTPITVSRIRAYHGIKAYGVSGRSYSWVLQYDNSGAWTTLSSASGGAINSDPIDTDNTALTLKKVTKIRYYATAQGCGRSNPNVGGGGLNKLYEVYCYGHSEDGDYAFIL